MSLVAITGTRKGITLKQRATFELWLGFGKVGTLCHGAAIGADEEIAIRCKEFGCKLLAFPCNIASQQSKKAIEISDEVFDEEPPLTRNRNMVDYALSVMAFPATMAEEMRSGTWATIRYANKKGINVQMFWPNGESNYRYA